MGLDIFAAQRLYGAPTSKALAGGQTFGFNSNVMYTGLSGTAQKLSMYDFTQDIDPVVTLYDYGSNNTLDLSGFTQGSTVDLNSGGWTSAAGMVDNIFIEYGTRIDSAVGGTGDDTFTANADGDTIDGGNGDNTVIMPNAAASFGIGGTAAIPILTDLTTGDTYSLTNIQHVTFGGAGGTTVDTQEIFRPRSRPWRITDGHRVSAMATGARETPGSRFRSPIRTTSSRRNRCRPAGSGAYIVARRERISQPLCRFQPRYRSRMPGSHPPLWDSASFGLFGATAIYPTLNVQGGSIDVTGGILDTFTGVFPDPVDSQTFTGGGTIDLDSGGVLEVGGSVAAGITIDFTDAATNTLRLDGVSALAPSAFAGTIADFAQGDTIALPNLPATAGYFQSGVLTLLSGKTTIATLNVKVPTPTSTLS